MPVCVCVCVCVCVHVYVLRMVSRDTILCFKNTFIIIVINYVMYDFNSELGSCVKVEVAILGLLSLIVLNVCGHKATWSV